MKKILFCMMAMIAAITFASCEATSNPEQVAEKIKNGQQLEQEDYTVMIKYVGEYAEKMQPYVVNGTGNEYASEMADLKAQYPYVVEFRDCLAKTPDTQMDSDNMNLIQKYAGYVEFTAPEGTTIQTDPEAAGLEEAIPDTTNGVVAGSVDEVKVKERAW